jgi:hypothetical protein
MLWVLNRLDNGLVIHEHPRRERHTVSDLAQEVPHPHHSPDLGNCGVLRFSTRQGHMRL